MAKKTSKKKTGKASKKSPVKQARFARFDDRLRYGDIGRHHFEMHGDQGLTDDLGAIGRVLEGVDPNDVANLLDRKKKGKETKKDKDLLARLKEAAPEAEIENILTEMGNVSPESFLTEPLESKTAEDFDFGPTAAELDEQRRLKFEEKPSDKIAGTEGAEEEGIESGDGPNTENPLDNLRNLYGPQLPIGALPGYTYPQAEQPTVASGSGLSSYNYNALPGFGGTTSLTVQGKPFGTNKDQTDLESPINRAQQEALYRNQRKAAFDSMMMEDPDAVFTDPGKPFITVSQMYGKEDIPYIEGVSIQGFDEVPIKRVSEFNKVERANERLYNSMMDIQDQAALAEELGEEADLGLKLAKNQIKALQAMAEMIAMQPEQGIMTPFKKYDTNSPVKQADFMDHINYSDLDLYNVETSQLDSAFVQAAVQGWNRGVDRTNMKRRVFERAEAAEREEYGRLVVAPTGFSAFDNAAIRQATNWQSELSELKRAKKSGEITRQEFLEREAMIMAKPSQLKLAGQVLQQAQSAWANDKGKVSLSSDPEVVDFFNTLYDQGVENFNITDINGETTFVGRTQEGAPVVMPIQKLLNNQLGYEYNVKTDPFPSLLEAQNTLADIVRERKEKGLFVKERLPYNELLPFAERLIEPLIDDEQELRAIAADTYGYDYDAYNDELNKGTDMKALVRGKLLEYVMQPWQQGGAYTHPISHRRNLNYQDPNAVNNPQEETYDPNDAVHIYGKHLEGLGKIIDNDDKFIQSVNQFAGRGRFEGVVPLTEAERKANPGKRLKIVFTHNNQQTARVLDPNNKVALNRILKEVGVSSNQITKILERIGL